MASHEPVESLSLPIDMPILYPCDEPIGSDAEVLHRCVHEGLASGDEVIDEVHPVGVCGDRPGDLVVIDHLVEESASQFRPTPIAGDDGLGTGVGLTADRIHARRIERGAYLIEVITIERSSDTGNNRRNRFTHTRSIRRRLRRSRIGAVSGIACGNPRCSVYNICPTSIVGDRRSSGIVCHCPVRPDTERVNGTE